MKYTNRFCKINTTSRTNHFNNSKTSPPPPKRLKKLNKISIAGLINQIHKP